MARACDAFVDLEGGLDIPLKRDGKKKTIEELIVESRNSKARLLHYVCNFIPSIPSLNGANLHMTNNYPKPIELIDNHDSKTYPKMLYFSIPNHPNVSL